MLDPVTDSWHRRGGSISAQWSSVFGYVPLVAPIIKSFQHDQIITLLWFRFGFDFVALIGVKGQVFFIIFHSVVSYRFFFSFVRFH